VFALFRTTADAGGQAFLWQARSRDDGRTWSEQGPTGMMGETPCLHRLPCGRLIVAYRKIGRLWDHQRAGLGLSWSDDHGKTWRGELTLEDPKGYQYKRFHETGNPGIVQLDDASVLILFYSFDPDLPFDHTQEPRPDQWADLSYIWKRYIAANIVRVR
jgi:hypothetical protein